MPRPVPLPEPMLARVGRPPRGTLAWEIKWDGFRALVRTGRTPRVRSRRGWSMTSLLPELALPELGELVLDGELVCWNEAGLPHFPLVCRRILERDRSIPVALVAFDLLAIDGTSLLERPYSARRELLTTLELPKPIIVSEVYDDGDALFAAVCERGLEGVVGKRVDEPYRPGSRSWIKRKNPHYWRRDQELELVRAKSRAPRQFV